MVRRADFTDTQVVFGDTGREPFIKVKTMLLFRSCNSVAIPWGRKRVSNIKAAAICLSLTCAAGLFASPTTIIVTNTNDNGAGSLRQALVDANDGDTIDATGISGAITLSTGELLVDKSVTINGAGADVLAIDGNVISRVFEIVGGAKTVSISGLTIRNGQGSNGGGIENAATVTLTIINSTLSGNAAGLGGGVFNSGTLTIINSTFSNNMASQGGGIYNPGSGRLTISNSTFSGNTAPVAGGVSFNVGTLQIANSTLSDNSADSGGGVYNAGTLTIINSAVSGNMASGNTAGSGGGATFNVATMNVVSSTISGNIANREGAGIYNSDGGTLTITNSTFSGNAASLTGGGVYNTGTLQLANSTFSDNSAAFLAGGILNFGPLQIGDTILNAGASGVNLYVNGGGTVTSLGYNISSDDAGGFLTGPGDQLFTNPMLGPLQDNGGPTLTHALLPGSPAIDAGDPNFTPPPLFDQRGSGFDRVVNGRIDVGSFEVQGPSLTPTPTATATATSTPTATPSLTPTPTATFTPTATATTTPTPSGTPSPTPTSTPTPRPTPSPRPHLTPRARPTPAPRL